MTQFPVKNRRSKISPGGIVTLPVSARRALGFEVGKGARVTAAVEESAVVLRRSAEVAGIRVSPGGQAELVGEPRRLLGSGIGRHYWLEIDDEKQQVALHPDGQAAT